MLNFSTRRGGPKALVLALAGLTVCAGAAYAQDAGARDAAPLVNKGDNAWMLVSSALVLMMSIPGLALFYGGLAPWMKGVGALDFAGGTVVHINASVAGLVGALAIGKRIGYGREALPPHSLTMSMIGVSLLWVGWFGFNAGSALEASATASLAFVNTMAATAAAALSWLVLEWALKGKPSLLGLTSGAVAGLVAATPASGFAGQWAL